jgi:hypothetical protein
MGCGDTLLCMHLQLLLKLDRNEKKKVSDLLEWNVLFGFVRNGTRCWRYGIQ